MIIMNYSDLNVVHLPCLLDTDPDTLLAKLLLTEQGQVAAVLLKRRMIRNVNDLFNKTVLFLLSYISCLNMNPILDTIFVVLCPSFCVSCSRYPPPLDSKTG